jgi:Protein of unknown function (DUF2878)
MTGGAVHPVLNFIASQVVWFLSLYGAGRGMHWLGSIAFLAFLGAQLRLSPDPRTDAKLAVAAACCGLILDTGYAQAGLLGYAAPLPVAGIAPYWILVMWANFGLTLNSSLRWLQRWLLPAALCAAAGAPPAYVAGVKLGAASTLAPTAVVYTVLAVTWAIAVPVLLALGARWSGGNPGTRK